MAVTLQDIAARAGVSKMTASLVLNSRQFNRVSAKTRAIVEQIAREMNYRPNQAARQLSGKSSGIIGLLMPRNARDYAFHRLQAIDRQALLQGRRLMAGYISRNDDDLRANIDEFLTRDVDGLIWMGHREHPDARVAEIISLFRSTVLIGEPVPAGVNSVILDYATSVQLAVEHLHHGGRKHVAMALEAAEWIGNQQRYAGYLQALKSGEAQSRAILWQRKVIESPSSPDEKAITEIVEQLAIHGKADAIIANNDLWAAEIIKGLRHRGLRVPQDVAVVGQDNSELARHFDPPITSLDLAPDEMAQTVMDLLIRGMQHPTLPVEKRAVALKLVLRESTGNANR